MLGITTDQDSIPINSASLRKRGETVYNRG
jgi:hypothetical protein